MPTSSTHPTNIPLRPVLGPSLRDWALLLVDAALGFRGAGVALIVNDLLAGI
ncbi:hypothetical protein Gdia_2484 [Gluconacetobacter diazotrophicus PA1 5]|uniref:hypothetical protein n=1 Tax=Gluconacetobacter diazotrophicus TaxID=33996 RepID=UPI000173DA68|nr:hypothetical protein [Gluconacetobacter diazotrophicus]ACI52228.1 hypothetical protein Gdia_2484 [Gluconacetobacter diazotrophicus PA1 5]